MIPASIPPSIPACVFGGEQALNGARLRDGISVVTPMYREADGAVDHVREILEAMSSLDGLLFEIIVVDDGSDDDTVVRLLAARAGGLNFRLICHDKNAGQSRAIRTGIQAAQYPIIGMIDGDGQNDPADIPRLYQTLCTAHQQPGQGSLPLMMVAGERRKREDSDAKRFASKIANSVRQSLLSDGARDSGCGLKVFYREAFLRLPYFDHLHRYLPFLMKREGYGILFEPVNHRARLHGASKYTNLGRLAVAIRDLMGVLWLKSRARSPVEITER